MKKDIRTLAALLIASATFVACSSSDGNNANENQQPVNPTGKYTMTLNASKSYGATTRALSLDGQTLNATWATTENVYVQKGSDWATGTLKPQTNGTNTKLKGELSSITINAGDNLTLQFPKSGAISYAGQVGTLADIAAKYDYATASVTVSNVSGGNIATTGNADFENQQAIVKFNLLNAGGTAISPSAFTVTDGTSTVSLTSIPAATYTANGATNVLYVAFPAAGSAKTVTLTATVGSDTYTYEKSGVTFTNGKYYEIEVKMTKPWDGNLSTMTKDETAVDGTTITGYTTKYKVTIASGATVTLDGATITSSSFCIKCDGSATIILKDGKTNSLTSTGAKYSALWAGGVGTMLTIQGETDDSGTLTVQSGEDAAGIGVGNGTCGNITISGGTVTAYGGEDGAGIGAGDHCTCGTITISGGTVTAYGGAYSAGIGSGYYGHCGNITISGGTVEAWGGAHSAGIGTGYYGDCGTINITTGVTSVKATKGNSDAASIGAGYKGTCTGVTIETGANVTQN